MSLEIGQVIGDYEVIGVIGAGGMGSVYKVRNVISDRVDAMKVLLPDLRGSSDLADRFLNEIKVLASLHHPNIASLHTALRVNNQLLMIMEFVDGTNLDERTRRGPVSLDQSVAWISQVLLALAYAHKRGVIHRDIKPSNIAINSEETVKLLDFGIARAAASTHLTRTGMVLGSLFYMSPEQVNGEPADSRSDLYSVGVTLYRLVTGRRPIEGESEFAVMKAQVMDMPPPPIRLNPALPSGLSEAIMRSLAKSPLDRFQTADQFREALAPSLRLAPAKEGPKPPTQAIPALDFGATLTLPSTSAFHAPTLNILQKNLAQFLGPIAGTIVKKQSRSAASVPDLCQTLAAQLPEGERKAFLKACSRELGPDMMGHALHGVTLATPIPAGEPAPPQPMAWDPAVLERSKKLLAGFIGPLAKVMVDRASKKARSVDELLALLSAEISSAKDREKFLAARGQIVS